MMTLGEKIRFHRRIQRISQQKLAEQLGITRLTLGKYESDIWEPSFNIVAGIAKALGLTLDYLAWG